MKWISYLAGLAGLITVIVLGCQQNWTEIGQALDHAGWALLWLLPFHAVPLGLDVMGWRALLRPSDPERRARFSFLFWVAAIREACNRLLPVANVGGELIGIHLVKRRGISGAATTASVLIEVLLTLLNQYAFTALGIVLLVCTQQATGSATTVMIALAASLPLPIGLVLLLRFGNLFSRIGEIAEKMFGGESKLAGLLDGAQLDIEVRKLFDQPLRMAIAGGWQFAGFVVGSFETWLAVKLLGAPITIWDAVAVEAITQAVRHIIFFVPAGLGVQESGLLIFGHMIGLPADISMTLSLIKRLREILFGLPALLSWQWLERHQKNLPPERVAEAPEGA